MRFIRHFTVFLIFIVWCVSALAQVAFLTKTSAKKIGKNETLEVTYEAQEGNIQNFSEPRFPGWHLVGGPNLSSSTVITNGKSTSSMSYQFLLKPESSGKLTIPGAKALIDGKQYASNDITIEVSDKDVLNDKNTSQANVFDPFKMLAPDLPDPTPVYDNEDAYFLQPGENIETKTKSNLFAVVDVSKKTCYPGEAIQANYKLYSRVNMDAHITKRPTFNGFSSIDLPEAINGEYFIETRNGKQYKVYPIRTVQLYPLQSGKQTLLPVEIDATIQYRKMDGSDLASDPLGSSQVVNYPYTVKSDPVAITVLPFPESNKPADFSGVTGNFTIETSTDYKQLAKNESGILRVTIEGSGNWAMMQEPRINWPAGIDVFEPNISEKLDSQSVPISGKRIYEFPFTSSNPGTITLPAVTLSYFDAGKKNYDTISSRPLTVSIKNTSNPLHKSNALPVAKKITDGTEMFTAIVKFVFPVAAFLLIGWFFLSYKNRKKGTPQEAKFIDKYQKYHAKNQPKQVNRYEDLLAIKKETVAGNRTTFTPTTIDETNIENINPVPEHETFTPLTSKHYFLTVKNKLQQLLKSNFNIIENPAHNIRQSLMQQGLTEEETDKITGMLQLCEKHIYSPFAEEFDIIKCNELLNEIKVIMENKKMI